MAGMSSLGRSGRCIHTAETRPTGRSHGKSRRVSQKTDPQKNRARRRNQPTPGFSATGNRHGKPQQKPYGKPTSGICFVHECNFTCTCVENAGPACTNIAQFHDRHAADRRSALQPPTAGIFLHPQGGNRSRHGPLCMLRHRGAQQQIAAQMLGAELVEPKGDSSTSQRLILNKQHRLAEEGGRGEVELLHGHPGRAAAPEATGRNGARGGRAATTAAPPMGQS